MNSPINEPVLLTGAGFTYNFRGFLAKQMWARILDHREVQGHPSLIKLLRNQFNFEVAYSEVMDGTAYGLPDKAAFDVALRDAYQQLDGRVRDYWGPSSLSSPIDRQAVGRFLGAVKN